MEVIIKIVITIFFTFFIYYQIVFVKWMWFTQIDQKETFVRNWKRVKPESDIFAIRYPNKIYQEGQIVGEITGEIETLEDSVIFRELCETSSLKEKEPFEHKRNKYRIIKINGRSGILFDNKGRRNDVLKGVICEKL